jgi:hypothetical protein
MVRDKHIPMDDPFFNNSVCVARLLEQYEKHGKLIVAVDFDDTVYDFYGRNHTYSKVIALLKKCNELEFPVVVYTARHTDHHATVYKYMEQIGVRITGVNKEVIDHGDADSKLYYNLLLDDKAGLKQAYEVLHDTLILIDFRKELAKSDKSLKGCKARFDKDALPFGGFPDLPKRKIITTMDTSTYKDGPCGYNPDNHIEGVISG